MKVTIIRLSDWANQVVQWVSFVLFLVMIAVVGAEVIARYVFVSPIFWSEELASMLFIWLAFLGASIGIKSGAHMGIHVITENVPQKFKVIIRVVSSISCSIFFLIVFITGIMNTVDVAKDLTPAMQISSAWEYAAVPVGVFFMLLHTVVALLQENTKLQENTNTIEYEEGYL